MAHFQTQDKQKKNRMEAILGFVLSRQLQFETIRLPWEALYDEVARFTNIVRENYMIDWDPAKKIGTNIYDGTPITALNLFADGLHGYMVSPQIEWFRLALPRHLSFLAELPEVNRWLQDVQSVMYSAFQNSNFYSQMRPFLKDGGSAYAATIGIQEDKGQGKIIFETLHPREVYIAHNRYGVVDVLHRKYKIYARVAGQSFDNDKLSPALKGAIKDTPFKEYEFIHAVYPRTEFDDTKIDVLNKKFASIWIETGQTGTPSQPLNTIRQIGQSANVVKESGFDLFPWNVWRYAVAPPSPYAYCPAVFALPENKSLQSIAKTLLRAGEVAVDPAMMVPSDNEGEVDLGPNGINYYNDDPKKAIFPINQATNYPIALDREEKKRETLREHFHVDFFLMLAQSQRQMTATEIIEKMGEKASVLSAAIGDLTSVLDQIIDNVFLIEFNARRLPPMPDILKQIGGKTIDIVYQGPLAQAQRRLFETQNVKLGLEDIAMVGQIYPEALDNVDPDITLKELLKSDNFPQNALRDPEDVKAIRKDRAERGVQEQAKTDSERGAKTMKDLAQAFKNAGGNIDEVQALAGQA